MGDEGAIDLVAHTHVISPKMSKRANQARDGVETCATERFLGVNDDAGGPTSGLPSLFSISGSSSFARYLCVLGLLHACPAGKNRFARDITPLLRRELRRTNFSSL